jgi:hypothetical protein
VLLKVRQHKKLYEVKCDTRITTKGWQIRFKYFPPLVEEIKASLEGAKWNAEEISWDVPITERNEYVLSYLQNPKKPDFPTLRDHSFEDSLATLPPEGLFNHQQDIYNFILSRRRCLIAADPGTGKTLPTLLAVERILGTVPGGSGQAVIVAPRSAQNEWRRQIERFGFQHLIGRITFSTYESLGKIISSKTVLGLNIRHSIDIPDILVYDESVKVKSEKAARSQSAFEFAQRVRQINGFIILLSGAPAPKDPGDWWHQIECLQPGYIRECSGKSLRYRLGEWDFTGEYPELLSWKQSEIKRFSKYISPYVLVIRKKDVFDLPEKIYDPIRIPVDADTRRTAIALAYNYDLTGGRSITLLHKLRELSDGFLLGPPPERQLIAIPNSPKERVVADFLDFYEEHGRIVIFGGFIESINKIKALCEKKDWLTETSRGGHTFPKNFLDQFDSDSNDRLAAVAYPGCVYGLNLSRTLALIYYSNTFNADDRLQSIERRDRPGMDTSRGTRVIDLIHLESDEKVMNNIVNKIGIHNLTLEEIQKCLKE